MSKDIAELEESIKKQDRLEFIEKASQFLYDWNKMQVEMFGPKAEMGPKDYTIPVYDFVEYMKGETTDKDRYPNAAYEYLKEKFIKEALEFLKEDLMEDYAGLIYDGFLENFKKTMNERL